MKTPNEALKYHVTGAIERGEKEAITAVIAKPHRLVTKYTKLLKSGSMTKAEINAFRKALGHYSKLSSEDKAKLHDVFDGLKIKIKITPEHTLQGITYLKKVAFNSKGEPRKTKDFPFSQHDLDVIKNFKEFRLVGLDANECNGTIWGYNSIWRVYSRTRGEYFDYVQGHWSNLYIVNRGFKKGTL